VPHLGSRGSRMPGSILLDLQKVCACRTRTGTIPHEALATVTLRYDE